MAEGDIEVETMRVADAEMDMAAILKEYLASEERVNQATREASSAGDMITRASTGQARDGGRARFKMGDEGIDSSSTR